MPILKYTLLVGASLLAIILVAGHSVGTVSTESSAKQKSASSLEILRKMANHGEARPFASAAAAGPFLAMPAVPELPVVAAIEPPALMKSEPVAKAAPSALNAQARIDDSVVIKPVRAPKKVASRKPKQRLDYVANVQREPSGFFGAFQSW